MFQPILKKLIDTIEGALGAAVMNRSGVIVESISLARDPASSIDGIQELGPIFEQLDGMRDLFDPGSYRSCVIHGHSRVTLIRPLDSEYLALLWVRPSTRIGRAKFKLRVVSPDLTAQL